jgi:hypothetical protein
MSKFITFRELKGLILIPLLIYFFYAITEFFFMIAAFDFMFTNNFTEAEMEDALVNSTFILTASLIIIAFYNTLTGYFVANYLKNNLLKISILTIISVEIIDHIVNYVLPADDTVYPLWQDILYYIVEWGAILLGAWVASRRLNKPIKQD